MEVRINRGRDITLLLTLQEHERLLELQAPTDLFYRQYIEGCLKGEGFYQLGFTEDKNGTFRNASDMEGFGKILLPELPGDAVLINLSKKGVDHYKQGWPVSVNYKGSHKLLILGGE